MTSALQLRRALHQYPELSGAECETAGRIKRCFLALSPDAIVDQLGGHGIAIVFASDTAGPTVMLRCELDAVPVQESHAVAHQSVHKGVAHQCGHDGHMAILAAVGEKLSRSRPDRGRVVLLYQPAEETGSGATAVINDPKFADLRPDFCFALHNLPGVATGDIVIRRGVFACASRGMSFRLSGTSAHAAQPETGLNPTAAMCQLIQELQSIPPGIAPNSETAFATVVGAHLGDRTFGTAPSSAEVWATIRSETDETMQQLVDHFRKRAVALAAESGLQLVIDFSDIFRATVNSNTAVDTILKTVDKRSVQFMEQPFRWSEDFGEFATISTAAIFGLGAGKDVADLHDPRYDFPDSLIEPGAEIFLRIVAECLGWQEKSRPPRLAT